MSEPDVLWSGEVDDDHLRVLASGAVPDGPIVVFRAYDGNPPDEYGPGEPPAWDALDSPGDCPQLWAVAAHLARQLAARDEKLRVLREAAGALLKRVDRSAHFAPCLSCHVALSDTGRSTKINHAADCPVPTLAALLAEDGEVNRDE